ncbi:hypothetical protein IMZ48_31225, partial [Candidatus Bathyarchaeota archaeon]|nr:hypothetical protein [Candidatus Bathyarchaeota archaeon]
MFEKPNQSRTSAVVAQKLARRATNFLLLGLSLPPILDLLSSTPLEFLRNFNILLSEYESFQQLHNESGSSASLSRARLPHMFRRGPGGKSRRSSSATDSTNPTDTDGGLAATAVPPSVVNFAGAETELL